MEKVIKVGIKTAGEPVIVKDKDYTLVKNMLIGDKFHWQTIIEAKLPGELTFFSDLTNLEKNLNSSNISLINTLPIETYLECVVGSEMNPKAPLEFLKAHAIISRSWALGKILNPQQQTSNGKLNSNDKLVGWEDTGDHSGFHVCSDDHCQRYQGLQKISKEALQAIRETEGEVVVSAEGRIIDTRFSKCCGGRTELFETCWQPLKPDCIESINDLWCDLSNHSLKQRKEILSSVLKEYDLTTEGYGYKWKSEISKSEITKNLKGRFGKDVGEVEKIEPVHRGPSGRIDLLRIYGKEGELIIGKELWIRRLLSSSHLYSSAFDIYDSGKTIQFNGKGWGHGVGLCQIGAANMALKGYSYKEILSFYYPGSQIKILE